MTVSEVIKKMVAYSEGNLHDINHFMKVYAYAKTIAEGENLNPELQKLVEVTAVVHDIACPLCRVIKFYMTITEKAVTKKVAAF